MGLLILGLVLFLGVHSIRIFAADWRQQGASIIGGCCGIFPEHIASLVSTTGAS